MEKVNSASKSILISPLNSFIAILLMKNSTLEVTHVPWLDEQIKSFEESSQGIEFKQIGCCQSKILVPSNPDL